MDLNIQHFEIIDSTNVEACRQIDEWFKSDFGNKDAINKNQIHKKIITASEQTAGRGRMNRAFYSPNKTGIYMSLIWLLNNEESENLNPAIYTASAAVAITRAIKSVFKIDTKIKWVNDIFLGETNISGILAEGRINPKSGKIEALVVGIGVNIQMPENGFPSECKTAGSILNSESIVSDEEISLKREMLVKQIAENIIDIYEDEKSFPKIIAEYREKSNLIGKIVTVTPVIESEEGRYQAEVIGITDNAELEVRLDGGEVRELSCGEVTLHVV